MKLIIDISDNTYNSIMARDWKNAGWLFSEELTSIHNGIPLENVLQEMRQEIAEQCKDDVCAEKHGCIDEVLTIIDMHIKKYERSDEE